MSKEMPLKVFAKQYRWNPKEEQWILDNDKDTHYYNNSALPKAWSSLSYPIYDGDYYFAFIHKKPRVNAQYNAKANRELRKYIKSTLSADEIFDKMEKYFAMQFKDAGSGDTMTREELWTAIVDARQKNPVKESFDVMDTYRVMNENYRKLAQKGMGTETKKSARVGLELDYYDSNGNKHMGKITKKTATGYTVQDDKTRKTHTFKFHDRVDAKKLLAAANEFDKNPLKGFPYNESLDEEVPEALKKQIERAVADVKRAQKFKSQASDRGDGRNALRRYQNKVWDAQDKLEALRDKAERLRG